MSRVLCRLGNGLAPDLPPIKLRFYRSFKSKYLLRTQLWSNTLPSVFKGEIPNG